MLADASGRGRWRPSSRRCGLAAQLSPATARAPARRPAVLPFRAGENLAADDPSRGSKHRAVASAAEFAELEAVRRGLGSTVEPLQCTIKVDSAAKDAARCCGSSLHGGASFCLGPADFRSYRLPGGPSRDPAYLIVRQGWQGAAAPLDDARGTALKPTWRSRPGFLPKSDKAIHGGLPVASRGKKVRLTPRASPNAG